MTVSLRYEDEESLVFDDLLALSPCHLNSVPTTAYIPDWRYLLKDPAQGLALIDRALDAKAPFSWLTADEAYGQVKYLRVWLEDRDISYVLATRRNDDVFTRTGAAAAPTR